MESSNSNGRLYVVATPIGNLADLSARAKQTLTDVNLIACEDTRRTAKLLSHFDISTPTESYHGDSSDRKRQRIVEELTAGRDVALVSDAGTPTVSDPGMRLVRAARSEDVGVVAVPGPSAVTAALSVSGLRADSFAFLGFVPRKQGRDTFFTQLQGTYTDITTVFFASPHRFKKTLADLTEYLSEKRTVAVCRELTKEFESVVTGSPEQIQQYFRNHEDQVRGEFVIVVSAA